MSKIKSSNDIILYLQIKPAAELTLTEKKYLYQQIPKLSTVTNVVTLLITFSELIERTFKRFFQSYALAFNEQHNSRKGNHFYPPFKRVKIETASQFTMAIIYTHVNATKHGLVKDFTKHKWSSWHSLISNQSSSL